MSKQWSKYQLGVFEFVERGDGNGLVEAKPGSGKTTVIEEAINRVPCEQTVLALAFNRHIRDELKRRMEDMPNVTVHTLNSFGNSVCRENMGWYKVNEHKLRNILKFDVFGLTKSGYTKEGWATFCKVQNSILRLVALAKAQMMFDESDFQRNWESLIDQFDIELPDMQMAEYTDYLFQTFRLDQQKAKVIDYDDQIAIPMRRGYPIPQFDRVFVDESQDLTPVQIALTSAAIKIAGLYVGDRRQAIYQFRGADSKAMDNIALMMECEQLPLSICYRCAKAIVREAQKIEPTIEYYEGSPEGEVLDLTEDEFRTQAQPGDVGLCRTTAPCVKWCLTFIRDGKAALVKGRDIGKNMQELVLNVAKGRKSMSTEDFRDLLREYHMRESEKLRRNEKDEKRIILEDKIDTILAVMEECETVEGVVDRFASIFASEEKDDAINLMTIHKAKGLEADAVYILRPDQLPHKLAKSEEALLAEENLKYVAITRAKVKLAWVHHSGDSGVGDGDCLS